LIPGPSGKFEEFISKISAVPPAGSIDR